MGIAPDGTREAGAPSPAGGTDAPLRNTPEAGGQAANASPGGTTPLLARGEVVEGHDSPKRRRRHGSFGSGGSAGSGGRSRGSSSPLAPLVADIRLSGSSTSGSPPQCATATGSRQGWQRFEREFDTAAAAAGGGAATVAAGRAPPQPPAPAATSKPSGAAATPTPPSLPSVASGVGSGVGAAESGQRRGRSQSRGGTVPRARSKSPAERRALHEHRVLAAIFGLAITETVRECRGACGGAAVGLGSAVQWLVFGHTPHTHTTLTYRRLMCPHTGGDSLP